MLSILWKAGYEPRRYIPPHLGTNRPRFTIFMTRSDGTDPIKLTVQLWWDEATHHLVNFELEINALT